MKNGKTLKLTGKQIEILQKKLNQYRVKKDFERDYNISIVTVYNLINNKRCCERIYTLLFNNKK